MDKEISIIIPCYNIDSYIMRCFESLKRQTLGFEKMELIFVNDASTDSTWDYISQLEEKYPENVIAINCEKNGRQGTARNIGLKYATAPYIGFVDGDDWVEPLMYELMLRDMKLNGQDIVYCKFFRDTGNEQLVQQLDGEVLHLRIDSIEKRKEFICSNCIGYGVWDKIYRKDFLLDNNIYFPEGVAYEDIFFSGLYYLYAQKVTIINYELYHYYVNDNSTVLFRNAEYHNDILKVSEMRYEEYCKRGLWKKFESELELDMLISGYIAALKVMFLRYDKVPFHLFLQINSFIKINMPNILENKYINQYIEGKHKVLVDLLSCDISEADINKIAEIYRKI